MVIWIIGLAGAGKTTVGRALYARVRAAKPNVVFLDGEDVRQVMGNDLGFTPEDRLSAAMRISRLCQLLDRQGIDVIVATLGGYPDVLAWNQTNLPKYHEVYLDVPMPTLEQRDQRGLYSGFKAGDLKNVVGLDIPFIPPTNPTIRLDTSTPLTMVQDHVTAILQTINARTDD